jgi:hypothetical protein
LEQLILLAGVALVAILGFGEVILFGVFLRWLDSRMGPVGFTAYTLVCLAVYAVIGATFFIRGDYGPALLFLFIVVANLLLFRRALEKRAKRRIQVKRV